MVSWRRAQWAPPLVYGPGFRVSPQLFDHRMEDHPPLGIARSSQVATLPVKVDQFILADSGDIQSVSDLQEGRDLGCLHVQALTKLSHGEFGMIQVIQEAVDAQTGEERGPRWCSRCMPFTSRRHVRLVCRGFGGRRALSRSLKGLG